LPIAVACEYVRQAALGLQHIHHVGLVHRDIKPSNLMLQAATGSSAVVKVLALGLAHFEAATQGESNRLTASGALLGTLDFLAPEQVENARGVDGLADLYSLGCTLYFLLPGKVPFPDGGPREKLIQHLLYEAESVERRRLDTQPEVAAVIRKLLAKKPQQRFQSAAEVVAALTGIGQPRLAPPPLPVP
jgi:serine/threonine-protein kinase